MSARMTGNATATLAAGLLVLASGCSERRLADDAPRVTRDAVEACKGRSGAAKQDCYEERLLAELDAQGVAPALALLEGIAAADIDVERDGHVYTHAIGINAYDPGAEFASTFEQCNSLFQSGCYHGVIQSYFIDQGVADAGSVRELCAPYGDDPADMWVRFQCLHGLGHGLTMFYGHNLPRALEDCDYLVSSWDRESCYGGAFMENVVNATNPHHSATEMVAEVLEGEGDGDGDRMAMAGRDAGEHAADDDAGHDADEPADHDMGGAEDEPDPADEGSMADEAAMADAGGMDHDHGAVSPIAADLPPWDALREDDPHYPCSVLDDRYQTACYMMQTSAMLNMNGGDIGEVVEECGEAPEPWRRTCFQSLGRDISSRTLQEPGPSMRECRKAPEEYREWCYVGLVKNFVDLTATTDAGFDFCTRVEDFAKPRCNEAMGEEIGILYATEDERRAACASAENFDLERDCLYGARVRSR